MKRGEVAVHVAVSYSTLKGRFRSIVGRSMHDEIVRVRIKRAQELLAEADLPIAKIAPKAGFHHQEYMGVVFKTKVGKTPGQYRKEARK